MDRPTYAEQIIKAIKEMEQPEEDYFNPKNDISNGYIIIKYKKLELQEKILLDGKISMCLPKTYNLMEEELAAIKYPDADRPQWIYTNEDTTVNFTFNLEEGEINQEEVEEVRDVLAKELSRLYPASVIEDQELIDEDDHKIGCFSFHAQVLDGEIFNFMFLMAIKEGLLMGAFNCSCYEKKQWKPVLKQMLHTLREIPEESGSPE